MVTGPMTEALDVLGVIPARGGSKRVLRKNLTPLLGEPLVVHAIRSARDATSIGRSIVSTEDDEIAALARRHGAEVIVRPAALATDTAATEDVLLHVLETLEQGGERLPAYVATLEPTSPLRTPELIDSCVALAAARNADSVITVVETRELYGSLDGDRFAYLQLGQRRRRQDREPLYRESGTVYLTRTEWLRTRRSVIADVVHAVVVPEDVGVDINTSFDLVVAEAVLRARREGVEF